MPGIDINSTADVITIVGGLITIVVAVRRWIRWVKPGNPNAAHIPAVEGYLKMQREAYDRGQSKVYIHSIDHLTAALRLPENAIFNAAALSKKIKITPRSNAKGIAEGHLFEYRKD
ncbi:MAG: hypothetical protein ABL897_07395 [Hyphomicrobium sp.]